MRRLLRYVVRYRFTALFALVFAAINIISTLIGPMIMRRIMDDYLLRLPEYTRAAFIRGVGLLLLLGIGIIMIGRIAKNIQEYLTNVFTLRIGTDIYSAGIAHSIRLPYSVLEDQRSGETLGIIRKCREDIQKFVMLFIGTAYITGVGLIFVVVVAFTFHWFIPIAYLASIPVLGGVAGVLSRRIKKVQARIVREAAELAGSTTESLRNIELVKSLGLADQEVKRLDGLNYRILGLELSKVKSIRTLSFVLGTMINLLRNLLVFYLAILVFDLVLKPGEYLMLMFYSYFLFTPLTEMGTVVASYREAGSSMAKFDRIMQLEEEERPARPHAVGELSRIEFENVTFRHRSGAEDTLSGVSFGIKIGESVAIVGPSGSGKTTLVKLLLGLYRPDIGAVKYNGVPSTEVELDELRRQTGLVTQDTQLFAGSVKDNLLFVNPQATDDELYTVLEQAACGPLLARADEGIDTRIGEGGIKISGGERQRLAIARALLRRPRMIVFDEATSSLDSLTEKGIVDTIRDLSARRSTIMISIAHRLATIKDADRIYVLERGRIVESGRHGDLIEKKGLYQAMWRQQSGERPRATGDVSEAVV